MYLVYSPEGTEPSRWKYEPKRIMAIEAEEIERRTGLAFGEFTIAVQKKNIGCMHALLYTFLRRQHPGIKYSDVQFAVGEVELVFSRSELQELRAEIAENGTGDETAAVLAKLDEEIAEAYDDTGEPEGKGAAPPKPAA